MTFAAGQELRAMGHRIGDHSLHLGDRCLVDQGALVDCLLGAWTHLEFTHRREKEFGEMFRDGLVNQNPVGRDAGLATDTELRGNESLDGGLEVSIFKDDEGSVAAEFHGHSLHGGSRFGDQLFPDGSRSGEAELPDNGTPRKNGSDHGGLACQHGEESRRETRTQRELR